MAEISRVWLPVVTPFADGAVDFASYERLLEHYLGRGISGIFPLGTTGESPTIEDDETEAIVDRTMTIVAGRVPVFVGIGGNSTGKVLKMLKRLERFAFPGIVSVCPYYNRPTQEGMREHFTRIAEATDRQIIIYNIPYRTGVNLANDTMLAHGGDGGILASAHIETRSFVGVYERMGANDHRGAHRIWSRVETLVPLLFQEANPMPIKYCLWRQGLIRSPECRLPLTGISAGLMQALDRAIEAAPARSAAE